MWLPLRQHTSTSTRPASCYQHAYITYMCSAYMFKIDDPSWLLLQVWSQQVTLIDCYSKQWTTYYTATKWQLNFLQFIKPMILQTLQVHGKYSQSKRWWSLLKRELLPSAWQQNRRERLLSALYSLLLFVSGRTFSIHLLTFSLFIMLFTMMGLTPAAPLIWTILLTVTIPLTMVRSTSAAPTFTRSTAVLALPGTVLISVTFHYTANWFY